MSLTIVLRGLRKEICSINAWNYLSVHLKININIHRYIIYPYVGIANSYAIRAWMSFQKCLDQD